MTTPAPIEADDLEAALLAYNKAGGSPSSEAMRAAIAALQDRGFVKRDAVLEEAAKVADNWIGVTHPAGAVARRRRDENCASHPRPEG